MTYDFELRLIGAHTPDGEVRLTDLAALADSLQALAKRIGLDVVDHAGPGRTDQAIAALTEMRLSGLDAGSTRLHFSRGRSDELALELAESQQIDATFWQIIDAVEANARPEMASDLIAESAGRVVAALQAAAPWVEFIRPGANPSRVTTSSLSPGVWARSTTRDGAEAVVTGRLEAVDLRTGRFRVVDDVGNRIPLEDVPRAAHLAPLISHRVRAEGSAVRDRSGRVKALIEPLIEEQVLPEAWSSLSPANHESELSKSGPVIGGGADLDDDEFAEFLSVLKG